MKTFPETKFAKKTIFEAIQLKMNFIFAVHTFMLNI